MMQKNRFLLIACAFISACMWSTVYPEVELPTRNTYSKNYSCEECEGSHYKHHQHAHATERAYYSPTGTDLVQTRSGYSFDNNAPGTANPRSHKSQFDGINENYEDYDDFYDSSISSNIDAAHNDIEFVEYTDSMPTQTTPACKKNSVERSANHFNNFYEIDYYSLRKKPHYVDYVPYYYRQYPYYYGHRYGPFLGNTY